MSEIQSKPYQPDPQQCCERCVFGRGPHARWCPGWLSAFFGLGIDIDQDDVDYLEAA